jgi:phage/plasmid-like protein (TIGR03299 family)
MEAQIIDLDSQVAEQEADLDGHSDGDGSKYAYVAVEGRATPWSVRGTDMRRGATKEKLMVKAGLDWSVDLRPVSTTAVVGGKELAIDVPENRAVVRSSDGKVLGIVGRRYRTVDNLDMFELGEMIVDQGGAVWDSAGSIRDGRRVFCSMHLPARQILVGGEDPVNLHLLIHNSHDGSTGLGGFVTPVRAVCCNTLALAIRGAKHSFTVTHSGDIPVKLEDARRVLQISFAYSDRFAAEVERMNEQDYTDRQFTELVAQLLPAKDPAKPKPAVLEARRSLIETRDSSPTLDGIRGTRWGAFNAVAEWSEWVRPTRTIKGVDLSEAKFVQVVEGQVADIRQRAFDRLAVRV